MTPGERSQEAGNPSATPAQTEGGPAPDPGGAGGEGQGGAGAWRRAPSRANGSRPPIGAIRSSCWRSRRRPGCPSWCRSATGGCWCRRSRSTAARPTRWRPIWPARRGPGWTCSSAAMRICRTSVRFAAPDRRLVFSINDFDETLPGPFEWDVKRLVASFAVAGRDRGFDARQRQSINRAVTRSYREAIREFAGMSNLDLWYSRIDVDEIAALAAEQGSREAAEAVRAQRGEGAVEGQPEGLREAHDDRRRRAQDRERPAAHRPDRGGGVRRRAGRARGVRARGDPLLPAHPDRRPPAAARALSLRPRGAQGRRRGQRRHARLDRAHARPRRDTIRCSCSSRRRRHRCSSRSWARARSPSTASGSSRVSD